MIMELMLGLGFGVLVGFILQKSHVIRYNAQINFLRGKDMRLIQCYASAMAMGMLSLGLLTAFGFVDLKLVSVSLARQILGGIVFGVGWGLAGYCPITVFASIGEGRLDALMPLLGFLVGVVPYALMYNWMKKHIFSIGEFGKMSFADMLHAPHIVVSIIIAMLLMVLLRLLQVKYKSTI